MNTMIGGRLLRWMVALAVVAMSVAPSETWAFNSWLSTFNSRYGTSGSRLNTCSVCHDGDPPAVNFYGGDVLTETSQGRTLATALANIEGVDSDGDGVLNLVEIQARTFPGDPKDKPASGTPVIGVAPTALAFGPVRQGSNAVLTATITNTGTATLSVTSLSVGGNAEFSLVGAPAVPLNVVAKGSAKISVRYAPTNTGLDNGALTIASNDSTHPSTVVALSGNGVASALTVEPPALAFGNLRQGQTTNLHVTLGNSGTADCRVSGLAKSGSADFSFGQSAPVAPFVIAPLSSVIVPLAYTPSDVGADAGSLQLTSDDPANPSVSIALSGAGDPLPASARITLNPISLSFGAVRVGQSRALSIIIGNTGGAGCSVTALDVPGGEFALGPGAPVPPFAVAPGAEIVVPIIYTPGLAGNAIGTLAVNSTDPNTPVINVGLSGSGVVPQIGVTPPAADFGTVSVGARATRAVGVTNAGGASLTVTSLVLTASAEFDYETSAPFPPFVVEPGRATNIVLVYAPAGEGPDAGTLDVGSDDPSTPGVRVTLSGVGQVPAPVPQVLVTPLALAFDDVRLGQSKSMKAIVSNTGGAIAHIGVPAQSGSTDFAFLKSAFDVAPGASHDVIVTYAPAGEGADAGSLAFTSDDPINPSVSISLSGRGVQSALSAAPASVSFGTVVTNGIVTRVVTLANGGTAEAKVGSLSIGGSGEFSLGAGAPAAPFSVAAGATVDVPLSYRPTNTGSDSATLDIASDDPAKPQLAVALSGSGILAAQAVDIDIAAFKVTEQFEIGISRAVEIRLSVVNRGSVSGSRTATVIGLMNGEEVYRASLATPAKGKSGRSETPAFPNHTPKAAGRIEWSAVIDDDDADSDVATATTSVALPVLDLDISEFRVSGTHEIGLSRPIEIQFSVVNRSSLSGSRAATVVGLQNGAEVYRATATVSARPRGGTARLAFKSFAPSAAGPIAWTATIQDDDPDADVAAATTAVTVPLVDLDISQFQVTDKFDLANRNSRPVQIKLKVLNRSKINAVRQATVVGSQGGVEVYRQSLPVSARPNGVAEPNFAAHVPRLAGQILWTASVEDDDADSDVATARTLVTAPPRDEDDDDDDDDDHDDGGED